MKHKLTHVNEIFDAYEKREKDPEESTPMGFSGLYKANCHLHPGRWNDKCGYFIENKGKPNKESDV